MSNRGGPSTSTPKASVFGSTSSDALVFLEITNYHPPGRGMYPHGRARAREYYAPVPKSNIHPIPKVVG